MNNKIEIYDSTLRDGAQMHKISFSVSDRIKIVKKLDEFGIDYIEAGNPGSNPKERLFFNKIEKVNLQHSKIVAFGSTKRADLKVEDDKNLEALVQAKTDIVCIYGKAWDFQVTEILRTTLKENLKMIESSIKFLIKNDKEVFFDAEHFFDGYKENKQYAIEVIKTAINAGATRIILCDTNGGTLSTEIYDIVKNVCKQFKDIKFGIHCHNDMELACANSLIAIDAGVYQVQGTINGYGERCGNANLCSIIPTLEIKKNKKCLKNSDNLAMVTEVARYVDDVANHISNPNNPYVGALAFTHKAGAHINAVNKNTKSFEHINPDIVGNSRKKLISELAGKSAIYEIAEKYLPEISKTDERLVKSLKKIKDLEKSGYQFEDATGSIELIVAEELGIYKRFINIIYTKVIIERENSVAVVKVKIKDRERLSSAEGKGPVDAIDTALRKAIGKLYKSLLNVKLIDYKVRALDSSKGCEARVLVNIQTSNGKTQWNTVGVSTDIVSATTEALIDSIEYAQLHNLL
ncbi:MAG: citramalate synthase [Clostridia bacterium]|nr:citramalate synthase [Clostridia bacterium]MBR3256005.1 citramalate synthase [Clostridia bacterium]